MVRKILLWSVLILLAARLTPAALAEGDLALIIANQNYEHYPNRQPANRILRLRSDFEAAGFAVAEFRDTDRNQIHQADPQIIRRIVNADRVVVVISGYVVHSPRDSWLMPVNVRLPNLFTVGASGLSIGGVLDLLALRPGESLLAVAETPHDVKLANWLENGFAARDIPQGVTVVTGQQNDVAGFLAGTVLVPGRSLAQGVRQSGGRVTVSGYLPRRAAFLPDTGRGPDFDATAERAFWQDVLRFGTLEAYQNYLHRYPNGLFAAEAARRIEDLTLTPQDRARIAEENLNLSRDQRREIQRHLTLLGYDTFGIDGVFGRRTRTAIVNWQNAVQLNATGYLNANQISRLRHDAAIRADQLRREAERRRLEEERRDRNYWNRTGAFGSEEGLLAYLERYPDGIFSDEAERQLRAIEREKRRQAREAERNAWDEAVIAGTVESYRHYLQIYPNGRFVEEAKARIQALRNPETPPEVVAAAKAEESRMNLKPITRNLIEARLHRLGLEPGNVDGKFTRETRRALRRFQRAGNLPVTGYVTRNTIILLLTSAVDN